MICRKCKQDVPEGAFCLACGAKQEMSPRNKKRGNGQGCVFRTASGSWAAEVTLGYYIKDGKTKRKMKRKCGFRTKKEAVFYLDALRAERGRPRTVTMAELWESYSSSWSLGKSKKCAYRIAWKKIVDEVGYRTIDSFSVDELQKIVDCSASSYYTRRDIKTVLSKLYQTAMRDDLIEKNRAEYISLPKLISSERETFSDADINALWDDYKTKKEPITAQILILLYTGMRPCELLTIRVENIQLQEQYMTGGAKTEKGRNRKIIIPSKLVPVVQEQMLSARAGKLAHYKKTSIFYETWAEKRAALGLRSTLTPYCARHTYISRLTALKVSPAMLQELAGHEDYETTLIYTHLSLEDRLREVNRLE